MIQITFSIIIPVFNTSQYLEQCLESIITQQEKNLEIICIDDNSKDNSLEVLYKYKNIDSRIKIIKFNKNLGAGICRNTAINIAKGKYICFVDSDDIIEKNLLSECSKLININPDIIIFGAKTLNYNTQKIKSGQYCSRFFPKEYFNSNIFKYHTVSWNKLYKTEFLIKNNIKFDSTFESEDQIFTIKSLLLAENINILKKDLYIYRKNRPDATTSSKYRNNTSCITVTYNIESLLNDLNIPKDLKNKILGYYILKSISHLAKTDRIFSDVYLTELESLLKFMKKLKGRFWWDYYKLPNNKCYLNLKLNYIKAQLKYILHEKLIILPAFLLFFLHVILEQINKGESYVYKDKQ
ncbi:glycosyltransferase [bacterium]|nr:glycosyltransferase [bacterium]